MLVAVAFAQQYKLVTREVRISISSLIHIAFVFLAQNELRSCAPSIDRIKIQTVLVTIEGKHHQFILLPRELNARDVTVSIERHLHRASHTALDVISQHRHLGILLTSLRVLILITAGIKRIFIHRRVRTSIPRERERLHVRFVKANPSQHLAVSRKVESTIERKFLFIHPVWFAVDDFVTFTILRDLALRIVE